MIHINKIKVLVFLVFLAIFGFLLFNPSITSAQSSCGGIFHPYEQKPASCYGTVVTHDAWLFTRPNKQWDFYKLRYEDRVTVDYIQDDMYFVKWYFSGSRDPIVGWVEYNKILLDRDVVRE